MKIALIVLASIYIAYVAYISINLAVAVISEWMRRFKERKEAKRKANGKDEKN